MSNLLGKTLLECRKIGDTLSKSSSDVYRRVGYKTSELKAITRKKMSISLIQAEMDVLYSELGKFVFELGILPSNELAVEKMERLFEKSAELERLTLDLKAIYEVYGTNSVTFKKYLKTIKPVKADISKYCNIPVEACDRGCDRGCDCGCDCEGSCDCGCDCEGSCDCDKHTDTDCVCEDTVPLVDEPCVDEPCVDELMCTPKITATKKSNKNNKK